MTNGRGGNISFVRLKQFARQYLPEDSELRGLILDEDDEAPLLEARPRLELYFKLVDRELLSSRR